MSPFTTRQSLAVLTGAAVMILASDAIAAPPAPNDNERERETEDEGEPEVTAAAIPVPDALHNPAFVTIDRMGGQSSFGLEGGYFALAQGGNASGSFLRFDLHGQYIDEASNVGGYVSLPFNVAVGEMDSESAISGLEVGGLYQMKVGKDFGLVLHGGLILPTAAGQVEGLLNLFGSLGRLPDLYNFIPGAFSARFGVSPTVRKGKLFARADLGLDVNLSREVPEGVPMTRSAPSFRADLGVGLDLGRAALTGELAMVRLSQMDNSHNFGTLAIGARYTASQAKPYISLVVPLDSESQLFYDLAITIGIDSTIP